jgi:hypothetical protein
MEDHEIKAPGKATYAELEFGATVSENSARGRRNLASLVEDIQGRPAKRGVRG